MKTLAGNNLKFISQFQTRGDHNFKMVPKLHFFIHTRALWMIYLVEAWHKFHLITLWRFSSTYDLWEFDVGQILESRCHWHSYRVWVQFHPLWCLSKAYGFLRLWVERWKDGVLAFGLLREIYLSKSFFMKLEHLYYS